MRRSYKNPPANKHNFSEVPNVQMQRSAFKRSHTHKTTMNSGYLIPVMVDEALPGDTFRVNLTSIARLATPIVPIMDNIYMDYFFFAVPNRLVWENWQKFMGERPDPDDDTDYTVPIMTAHTPAALSLSDYFGLPVAAGNVTHMSLYHRAYNLIYNEWFRDQNLQDSVVVDVDDGPDSIADYVLLKRGKRHDYFTSCLPWPAKNGDQVDLPLGTSAPVIGDGNAMGLDFGGTKIGMYYNSALGLMGGGDHADNAVGTITGTSGTLPTNNMAIGLHDNAATSHVYADLSSATAATINSLREAFQLQRMLERDARGGTRYVEIIKSHFGVTSPDFRLQRPEYLGGGTRPVNIQVVPQTSQTATTPQGTLTGVGYQQSTGISFSKSFVEHSIIMCLVNIRADLTYQTGLNRLWSRSTKYDYFWPALAHLGEQTVLNKEIFHQGTGDDALVFGYQERWAEYRYKPSLITGQLRSNHATSLDVWHLSQDFGVTLPVLDTDFIEENPPIDRIIATTNEPEFIFDGYFDMVTTRPMPTYSVPGLIDHF